MATITEHELLLISKAKSEKLRNYAEGVSLTQRSGKSIEKLRSVVITDRMRLARAQLQDAVFAARKDHPRYRTAISRAYYAMYHAARAVTYLSHGGDDHEEHSALPKNLPPDFPEVEIWRNKLKNARLERNKADYDPYPKQNTYYEQSYETIITDAKLMIKITQQYIKERGQ
ncbi:HEPN domain-containing protein [Paracidovorax wautersii]|uniref:HEPN domain-containing protein n=1 Tax=Paracidovorax wautersii TaxID=1177982 RepID=UPI0031D96F5B